MFLDTVEDTEMDEDKKTTPIWAGIILGMLAFVVGMIRRARNDRNI